MDLIAANFIVTACENNDVLINNARCEVPRLKENYSGRGMYGDTTTAIKFEGDIGLLAACVIAEIRENNCDEETLDAVQEAFARIKTDWLGRGSVFY